LRYENVFGVGKVFRKFAVRAQHSVEPNRNRISLRPEIAGLEIRQQTPQNPTRVFKGDRAAFIHRALVLGHLSEGQGQFEDLDVEAYAPGYIVQDMAQQEQPGPDRPREEPEPAGEKLKKLVEEHSEACDEIKEELAGHKEGTIPQSSPLSE
jgi:hypothetical protein